MVDPRALHSITASMHEGMLTLAVACIILRILFGNRNERIRRYTEPTALLAAFGGTVGIFLSGVTGVMLRPTGVLLSSSVLLNKIMFTAFIAGLWILVIFLQVRYRNRLWSQRSLSVLAMGLAFLGYGGVIFLGSTGGHLSGKESVLDSLYALLNTSPEALWVASPFYSFAEALKGKPFSLTVSAPMMLQIAVIVDVVTILVLIAYVFGLHEAAKNWLQTLRKQTHREKSEAS